MPRFFAEPENIKGNTITLYSDDAAHISRVLRGKTGDILTVCDGTGSDYIAEITDISDKSVILEIKETLDTKSDNTVTNSNAIIGKTALVTEEISLLNSTGQINVDGEIWSAKTMDPNLTIPKGSKVEIIGIDGVKACVASNYQMPSN